MSCPGGLQAVSCCTQLFIVSTVSCISPICLKAVSCFLQLFIVSAVSCIGRGFRLRWRIDAVQ